MFVRFTERARRAVELANEEASAAGQDHVGTEHLLLGLLREPEGVAGRVLAGLGVTVEDVRSRAGEVRPPREPAGRGVILSAPRTKRVLELADELAAGDGERAVDTQDILIALVRGDGGPGARILRDLGVGADRTEDAVDGFSA
jgi:ATP-dependent Clp protease ATP-binding subunit ClpC